MIWCEWTSNESESALPLMGEPCHHFSAPVLQTWDIEGPQRQQANQQVLHLLQQHDGADYALPIDISHLSLMRTTSLIRESRHEEEDYSVTLHVLLTQKRVDRMLCCICSLWPELGVPLSPVSPLSNTLRLLTHSNKVTSFSQDSDNIVHCFNLNSVSL